MAAALLVAALALIATTWGVYVRNGGDLAVLTALAVFAFMTDDLSLPAFRIDTGLVLALAAIILTGPVGALAVLGIPELVRPLVERHPVRRIATVANLASFAWLVVVGQALVSAVAIAHGALAGEWLTYTLVACAMALVNCLVAMWILYGLLDGVLISRWRVYLRAAAVTLAFAPFAALTAALLPSLGILALVVVAAAAGLPGLLVHLVTWTPRAGGLSVPEARSRYAAALASRMELSPSERRVLLGAARWGTDRTGSFLLARAGERDRIAKTLLLAGLWSRSEDCFSRLQPPEMGLESRVLLVAHGWAELTARGTDQLEHRLALLTLHNNPRRYDRRIVAIARDLIPEAAREEQTARIPCTRALSRRIAQAKLAA